MLCATQDGQVIMKSSDKMWSPGGGNGKPPKYSCHENPMNSMKRQRDMTSGDDSPMSEGVQYATGEKQKATTNRSRKTEVLGQIRNDTQLWMCLVVKVQCCKEQYCIGIWNVRSVNQGKLDMVRQEMARVNMDILGISELKWMGMGEFNSDDYYIYYCGQESLRRN